MAFLRTCIASHLLTLFVSFVSLTKIVVTTLSSPNIIFIFVDDFGYTDISANGAEFWTPNLDSLQNNGIKLNYHYVGPRCSVTRSQALTGRYSWNMGVSGLQPFARRSLRTMPPGIPTIGDLLRNYGRYSTYAVGKWHIGMSTLDMLPLQRGFDHFYSGYLGSDIDYYDKTAVDTRTSKIGYDWYRDNWFENETIDVFETTAQTNGIIHVIDDNAYKEEKEAFFIYAGYQVPHTPLEYVYGNTSENCDIVSRDIDNNRYKLCLNIQVLDYDIGRIVTKLKENNMWNNTLIVFISDNGGDRVAGACNYPFRGHKLVYFEGGI